MEKAIKLFRNNASEEILHAYLADAIASQPGFLRRIGDLHKYVEKLKRKATIFEARDDNSLVGLLAGYFNDSDSKIAFISLLSVAKKYQGKGIARMLMAEAVQFAKENGFLRIDLEVDKQNQKAIAFYKKLSFENIEKNELGSSFFMERYV